MKNLRTLLCLCILLFSVYSYAVNRRYGIQKVYDRTDGLLSNTIDCINQDSEGYLYFCTNKGLSVFDGNIFKNYNAQNVKGFSNMLQRIIELDSLHLLVGSRDKGLFLFDKQKNLFRNALGHDDFFNGLSVKSILKSSNGIIWIGCSSGELWYILDSPKIINGELTFDDLHKVPYVFPSINDIYDLKGSIYIACQSDDLYAIHGVNDAQFIEKVASIPNTQSLHSFLEVSGDELWIGTDTGISVLKKKDLKWKFNNNFAPKIGRVRSMVMCNNRIFVGTEGQGIVEVDRNTLNCKRVDGSKSQKYVISLKADQKGNLWAGTWMGGVDCLRFSESLFTQYYNEKKETEMFTNVVWNIFQANGTKTQFFLGTQGGGLCTIDEQQHSISTLDDTYKAVWSIYTDSLSQNVYVGTWGNGLRLFDVTRKKYVPLEIPALSHERIVSIYRRNSHELFIGTSANGLWLFDEQTRTAKPLKVKDNTQEVMLQLNVRKIEKNKYGKGYWMGTFDSGIILFDLDKHDNVEVLAHYTMIDNNPIQVISFLQSKSKIWVCTTGGLICMDIRVNTAELKSISQLNGYYLSDVFVKNNGFVFLASQDGLLVYDSVRNSFHTYLKELIIYRILPLYGKLYLGTSQGLLVFDSDLLEKEFKDGVPLIRSLSINGTIINPNESDDGRTFFIDEAINYVDTLNIPAGKHNVKFMLSSLSSDYLSAGNVLYYKMDGLDSYWSKAIPQDPYAEYRNLPSGVYKLHVRYNSSDNSENEKILTIVKDEYWWKTSYAIAVYIYILFVVFVYLIIYFRSRYKSRYEHRYELIKRQKEEEVYQQKVRFFTNISHDLKTPLTLLITPLIDLSKHPEMPEMFQARLRSMIANGDLLMKKINKILNYRNSEEEDRSLNMEMYSVYQLLYEIIMPFKEYAEKQGLNFNVSFPEQTEKTILMQTDREKLESILENLISNAIKYTPEGGTVDVEFAIDKSELKLKISDTGRGIAAEDLPHIFDRYFRISSDNRGTGIGLYLVKLYVDLLGGSIDVESSASVGTSFLITLPSDIHAISKQLIYQDEQDSQKVETGDTSNLLRILVVDDNKELREYLKQLFSPYYEVLEACDGQQALEMVQKCLPDIIISDLIMPEMDGLTLCKNIKNNMQTSHIPFIILSAKSAVSTRIECWETGVDLYEQKPFNSQLLLTNVSNLLRSRRLLKYKYQIATPALAMGEKKQQEEKILEEQFFNEVNKAIERNMDKPELSVSELAEELNMTQEQLYHKLKTLSGMSPNQYIRTYRLNCAAAMLRSKKYMVTEVLYSVGFNNPSYFTRCFKKQFGVLPSEYVNNLDDEDEFVL